ncbi:IS3 family transposase [Deinococcus sp. S9]|uniref:IS3 family transposase n=1 Tax=Deinococcus sp. S9 TaxID=2545754 RepID=UPI0010566F1A|nr:IS3 family transposase [Deinococcus sp. S9]TDE84625.1 transposase [Deinococcus sp. S9]
MHTRQDQQLSAQIRQVHQKSKGQYGAPRVHAELRAQSQHREAFGRLYGPPQDAPHPRKATY